MLAGQIVERGKITLVDVEEPTLGECGGEIIFQPELGCLCGSDMPFFDGQETQYPQPVGYSLHEMIGTVVATSGQRFKAGDRVLAVPVNQQGLWERYPLSDARAIPLDPRPAPEEALMAQPLGTAIFALRKLQNLLDKLVVVLGQGPMGQLFCMVLRNLGAREIIAVDPLESRLERSMRSGATHVVCAEASDAVDEVRRITGGQMADVVIEAVGHREQALNACAALCRHGGSLLYFGVPPHTIDAVRWRELFFKNITVQTSVDPDFTRDFPLAMRWIAERRLDVAGLITHRYPLAEIQTAFETFRDRREGALKVLVDFPAGG